MPETPDFHRVAREVMERRLVIVPTGRGDVAPITDAWKYGVEGAIAEALRQVWNARGAADLVAVDVSLTSQMGATASGRYVRNLDRALRSLDR